MIWLKRLSLASMAIIAITLLPAKAQTNVVELRIVGKNCFQGKIYSAGALRIRIFEVSKASILLRLADDFEAVARRGNNAEIERMNNLRGRLYEAVLRASPLVKAKRASKDGYVAFVPRHMKVVVFGFTTSGEDDIGVARTFVEPNDNGREDVVLRYYSAGECKE